MIRFRGVVFSVLFFASLSSIAQTDTLKISLREADRLFVTQNFYLLASAMNIEAQKAEIIQAKLFPNPVATAEFNAYDPQNEKAFHTNQTGEKSFQIDQLILLGGKRRSQIEMAKSNADIAELELQNLARGLKFQLHTKLVEIGQQQVLLRKYNSQLALLDTILTAYEEPVRKGNIALKDFVRLKGVYLNLNNDRADLLQQYFEAQSNVQTLLQTSSLIYFEFSDNDINSYIKVKSLEELKEVALDNHPELLIMRKNRILADQYLRYQKQLAVPDVNVFVSYDQRGGAFTNQLNTGLAIPLPVFNRNQGAVKSSAFRMKQAEYTLQALEHEKLSALQNHFALYSQTVAEYQKANRIYNSDFELTIRGMTDNFQKRNVSLIEFVDFFESYNQVLAELARIKTQLVTSAELLNLSIGKDVY
ncbi:MAG: TolC family protein [Chryseolinea sp.]